MRRLATGAGLQVFVLVGPLASRIAASLSPQQSALVSDSSTRILLEDSATATTTITTITTTSTTSSTQTQIVGSLGQQVGATGSKIEHQDDALPAALLKASAAPFQHHRLGHQLQPLQLELQQQQLATGEPLLGSMGGASASASAAAAGAAASTIYDEQGQSLAATLARLSGWELLLVVALISLILISIVGNCLVCVAIFTDRRLRKLGNAFIVSLAIADLFVSCLVMTFALCNDLMDWWMFGQRFCDIWMSFDIMCCTASILNLCAISLDRFIHIKDCLLYNQLMTRRVALSAVLGIWLVSALVSFVPINLGWHKPNHFKSHPTAALNGALLMNGHAGATATAIANETHAMHLFADTMSEPPSDNLMHELPHNERVRRQHRRRHRRQATPSELGAPTTSENSGIQQQQQQPQHFDHSTQLAQLADAPGQVRSSLARRSANKDFVRTKRPRPVAGNHQQQLEGGASSGLDGGGGAHTRAAGPTSRGLAQVDFGRLPANHYDSDQLTGGRALAMAKQSDDQVEFNPQDGPSKWGEQIKPQLRKKRLAPDEGSAPAPMAAQTDRSSGRRWGRATALLDHADERPWPMGDVGESPIERAGHSASASGRSHRSEPERRQFEQRPGGAGAGGSADRGDLPQCVLTLTPTYAIISSTISFYIPCLIMLGLYIKLFACARRHVRNIRAITRAPHPIASAAALAAASAAPLATNVPLAVAQAASNGAGLSVQSSSRAPASRTTSSSFQSRSGQLNELAPSTSSASTCQRRAPLASRARTWIKFAVRRSPGGSRSGSGSDCGPARSLRQASPPETGSTGPQSVGPIACQDNSTSAASSSSSSSSPFSLANDRGAGRPHSPMAQKLSTTSGANEKTIGQTAAAAAAEFQAERAREDEPFLKGAPSERDEPAISTANDYCDTANDSLTRAPSSTNKFVGSATGVKLNLVPSEFHHQQQQRAAAAAAASSLASQLQQQQQQQQHKQQQTSHLATHKAAITLGIIMGTFLFCWVPFFCLNIIKAFYVDSISGSMFRAFTWLGYANSALNPIIYGIHNSEFRNAFNRIFFKHLTLKNGRHYLNRRFSYDLRPHHHQHHHQARDHQHQQPHHATNHIAGGALSGAAGVAAAGANHQLGAEMAPSAGSDKRQASQLDDVRALVDHERRARTESHKGQQQQQQLQEPSTMPMSTSQRSLTTFQPTSERT